MSKYTPQQQSVIDYRGGNMLVSASAGTGKTTVMIERIAALIEDGADVSELAVVTFTNLAAAEMKKRLSDKLAENRQSKRMVEQLERIDNASISTLHSFCSELLRNWFYVADVDPAFSILDDMTVASLQKQALDDVFLEYFAAKDKEFRRIYKIFSTHRSEDNFRETVTSLYNFARCLENFDTWYAEKRANFTENSPKNPVILALLYDINQTLADYENQLRFLAERCTDAGLGGFAEVCAVNADNLLHLDRTDLQTALFSLAKFNMATLPRRDPNKDFGADKITEELIRNDFDDVNESLKKYKDKYENLCRGLTVDELWKETCAATLVTDKLVEVMQRFDAAYFALKKQRGGLDFNDLEHLTLQILEDAEAAEQIRNRYKYVFVDEYQDINPVQESIIAKLSQGAQLFFVGDVKQSIYGFRGCEPTIFLQKYHLYKCGKGKVVELNANFRSNNEILKFVNEVFCRIMSLNFGKVNYRDTAQLSGVKAPCLAAPSVQIDLVLKGEKSDSEVEEIYDVTQDGEIGGGATQGELIVKRISEYVGLAYVDKKGETKNIGYGDIVILMRSMKDRAADVYSALVEHNIPVTANLKATAYANKEVRDLITLLRVIDNPYCDVYVAGLCLSPIGGFDESQLAQIKIATQDKPRTAFYTRMRLYAERKPKSIIGQKISALFNVVEQLRFYSYGATVDELALKVLEMTEYHLYVQGLPNGGLRLRKMYAFVDGLKGANYAQSVDKFLAYLDETAEEASDEGLAGSDAVRIMTMHASKGLEFPVVILAGLETTFNTKRPKVERNVELGIASRYYDLDAMRVANTLGTAACSVVNLVKLKEEEMRLLYVAMTRAEFALDVVGTISQKQLDSSVIRRPSAANSHLDWILTYLRLRYGNFLQAKTEEKITVVDHLQPLEHAAPHDLLCPQYTDSGAVEEAIGWVYPFKAQTEMPSKIVSSALDKEYLDVDETRADFVLEDNADRNFVGTAYHKVLQYVDYDADKAEISRTIEFLVNNYKIDKDYADKLSVDTIYDTLNNADLRKLMAQGRVFHELPFMLYAPYNEVAVDKRFTDQVMLQGVIDLLVLGEGRAVVVDFKYTTHSEKVREKYRAQLASYRLAVQQICGIQDVKCYVLSIEDNKLIEMD